MLCMLYTGTHICSRANKHANSTKVLFNMMLSETLLLKLLCLSTCVDFLDSFAFVKKKKIFSQCLILRILPKQKMEKKLAYLDTLTEKYPPGLCN